MFYKIRALHHLGWQITVHYFDYRAGRSREALEPFCSAVYAYKRSGRLRSFPVFQPYIVQSRVNADLIQRMNADSDSILLEGVHCAGILPFIENPERVVLRMHNDEAVYYRQLAAKERFFWKKAYFRWESRLLHRYQLTIPKNTKLACLSRSDQQRFERDYRFEQTRFIPAFTPWQDVRSKTGIGTYCLYHGNLTVSENREAAYWLLTSVFPLVKVPCVIAGRGMPRHWFALTNKLTHVRLVDDPPSDELDALVRDAHLHLLPSGNATGVKIKLLHVLFNGRFCLTNAAGVEGSGLADVVEVKESAADWIDAIARIFDLPFTSEEIEKRKKSLTLYNNQANAAKLSALW